eukprot:3273784-Pleurochrysis_carterae.AAC.1
MYGQATRTCGLVFRLTAAVYTCRNTPLEQAATSNEGQNKTIARRRRRRENCFYIGEAALCGRRFP